ncbi:MAG: hypothetical protein E6621_08285 [Cutibacterium avidum]|nr:hypothetical protein [Cutibacterium avidum]
MAVVLVAAAHDCGSFPALDGGGGLSAGGGFGTGADGATCSPAPGEDDPGGCELGVLGGVGSPLAGGVPCCGGVSPGTGAGGVFPPLPPPSLLAGVWSAASAAVSAC